ncbi:hypothetical protein CspHIS471_0100450 [Cutaneotrichosporon sp. HIS471]|nr:hypothetical protein CspHIS471_0100450 [Cutaneotrichosporon sp. HIS471]
MTAKIEQLITGDPALKGALPPDFIYAGSTAAFQIEGSPNADGKGPSVWDRLLHGPKPDGGEWDNGDVACDSYVRWREDLAVLKAMGANAYRFSISWPRIIPDGHATTAPNAAGIAHYAEMVDAVVDAGLAPVVTLFHWDIPAALDDAYGGFDSEKIIPDFVAYARVVFTAFPKVKHWITINEPFIWTLANAAVLKPEGWNDDKWADYVRHMLLAHAAVVDMYRREFGPGQIGISLNMDWVVPIDDSHQAKTATQDIIDHWLGMAVMDGVDVGAYMAWSLLDNLEWSNGFGPRFGITAVGPAPEFKRTPKDSAYLLRRVFEHLIRK